VEFYAEASATARQFGVKILIKIVILVIVALYSLAGAVMAADLPSRIAPQARSLASASAF